MSHNRRARMVLEDAFGEFQEKVESLKQALD